jgi:hypothetical protein
VFELSVGDFYYNAVILNTIMMKYLFPVMILLSTVCFSVESFSRMHRCFLPTVRVGTKMQSEPLAKKVDEIDRSVHLLKKDLHSMDLKLNITQIALEKVARVEKSQVELMKLGIATRTDLMVLGNATRAEFMQLGKSVATRTELMELSTTLATVEESQVELMELSNATRVELMQLSAKVDVNAAKTNSNDSNSLFLMLVNTVIACAALFKP